MAISIADKLAALRTAKALNAPVDSDDNRITLPNGQLSIHDAVFHGHLEIAGRNDIEFLMTRCVSERDAILQMVEINPHVVMIFGEENA